MKKIGIVLLVLSFSVNAMTHYLVASWMDGGQQYCKYSNGSVLVLNTLCPLTIED